MGDDTVTRRLIIRRGGRAFPSGRLALLALLACGSMGEGVAHSAPIVRFVDVDAGPVRGGPGGAGVPIAIFGTGFGARRGTSTVTIGGRPVARYLSWGRPALSRGLRMIVVQPGPRAVDGRVAVRVGGQASRQAHRFAPTAGRVFWIAPRGLDTDPCSQARPCLTIQHVVDEVMRPGDALLVRGGPVADDEVWVRAGAGGQPGRPLVIRNAPGERPLFVQTGRPVILEGSHVTFSGFRFGPGKSVVVGSDAGARNIRVTDNSFTGTLGFDAVGTHGDDLLVAGNVCAASGSTVGTQGHCYYISNGSRVRLLWNEAGGVPGYGIHIFDQQRSAQDIPRRITDVLVEGNLLSGSTERSGLIVAMGDEGGLGNAITRVRIRGNTFTANNHAGVVIGSRVSGVTIENNRFIRNGRQAIAIGDDATIRTVTISGNLFDQTPNASCRTNCDWYPEAHVQVGDRASGVTLRANRYRPGPPRVLGARPG